MTKIIIYADVDKKKIMGTCPPYKDLSDAISSELHWVEPSGIYVTSWDFNDNCEHTFECSDVILNCYSESANFDYFVVFECHEDLEKAKPEIEEELRNYICPDYSSCYDYYYNAGYCEVVENKLNQLRIPYQIYDKKG